MFTQKISMDCTKEQYEKYLKDELLKMGYQERTMFWGRGIPVFTNAADGITGGMLDIREEDKEKYGRTYLGSFNAPLFLALAAMTDGERMFGYGEWRKQKNGDKWVLGEAGENCNPYWRKATKEEIMDKFGDKKYSPKDGEYFTYADNTDLWVGIKNTKIGYDSERKVYDYCHARVKGKPYINMTDSYLFVSGHIRPATNSEKAALDQMLAEQGFYFDKEKCKIRPLNEKIDKLNKNRQVEIKISFDAAELNKEIDNVVELSDEEYDAIDLLKSKGYKILRKTETWEEV